MNREKEIPITVLTTCYLGSGNLKVGVWLKVMDQIGLRWIHGVLQQTKLSQHRGFEVRIQEDHQLILPNENMRNLLTSVVTTVGREVALFVQNIYSHTQLGAVATNPPQA